VDILTRSELECDILIAGGGLAGVACALEAARCGAKVVLCHDRPVLGGNASSEIRMHVVGADCGGQRGMELQTEARESGIIEEIRLDNCVQNPQRSASVFDLILYDKCLREPNIKLLLNTAVTDCTLVGDKISQAVAEDFSAQRQYIIAAKVFVDATGDGYLGAAAGAKFRLGREAKAEFGESLAPDEPDSCLLGSSLLFQARQYDHPVPFVAPPWARQFSEDDLKLRPHALDGIDTGLEYGYWWLEWGGHLDTIGQTEEIRHELLAILMGVWDHVKNAPGHGAENWALEWMGFLPGKRESRRFVGLCTINQGDIMAARTFDDAIAFGGWPLDLHPVMGVDSCDEEPCDQRHVPHLYDIPLRACISANVGNLMFAGRNISATHVAFASTRVMATCAAIGQGVGSAAALACRCDIAPSDLPADTKAMREIQQTLLRHDCFLVGLSNSDKHDLARQAQVIASSQQADGPADNVLSGQTRSTQGPDGTLPASSARSADPLACTHRWMSDPNETLPQWIELSWPAPVSIGRVEIIFDTGLHRSLTLTHSDAFAAKMIWGQAQPETLRDYTIESSLAGQRQMLASVTGNYQRLRTHDLPGVVQADTLRITATATNGLDHARICEIRAYAKGV
jgi:hypothetical protein